MRNLKLTLAYDGADFSGWQVQPDRVTVQGTLAAALERVTGERLLPQGSGRTDAGVHALAQVASCAIASPIPAANLLIALNDVLPAAVRVMNIEQVAPGFHARHSACAKTYSYRIYRGAICPPFLARFVYHHPWPLDEPAMMRAAHLVEVRHDFTSFAAVDPDRQQRASEEAAGNVRTIYRSEWQLHSATERTEIGFPHRPSEFFSASSGATSHELIYTVRGDGFLQHMVRNLVGTFLLIGKGTLHADDLPRILAARERSANPGATVPARGLWLMGVEYPA